MRILILGTSNSLLKKGWVYGLKETLPNAEIHNFSVGMSSYAQFAARMRTDFSAYDYVFFDSIPNDEALAREIGTDEFYYCLLKRILSTISAQSRLIVVGFCWKQHVIENTPQYLVHKRIAQELGVPFMEIPKVLIHLAGLHAVEVGDLYEGHDAHPHSSIACSIGQAVAQCLLSSGFQEWQPRGQNFAAEFSTIRATPESDWPAIVQRKNSIMDDHYFLIDENQALSFPRGLFVGGYVDMASTYCDVEFWLGGTVRSANLRFGDIHYRGHSFRKIFVAIPNGVLCDSLKPTLAGRDYISASRYASAHYRAPCRLCISELCFWTRGEPYDAQENASVAPALAGEDITGQVIERMLSDREKLLRVLSQAQALQ